jgi:hypothetical protein
MRTNVLMPALLSLPIKVNQHSRRTVVATGEELERAARRFQFLSHSIRYACDPFVSTYSDHPDQFPHSMASILFQERELAFSSNCRCGWRRVGTHRAYKSDPFSFNPVRMRSFRFHIFRSPGPVSSFHRLSLIPIT